MSCEHPALAFTDRDREHRLEGEHGLPRQVTFYARCEECGETVAVDYNIAFIDGGRA